MKIQIQIKPKEVKVKTHFWMKGENCVHFVKQNSLSIHIKMKTNHRQGNRLFKFFIVVCREVCGTVSELLPFPVCLYPGVVMDNPWSVFLFPFSLHLRETHSMFQTAGGNQTHPHSCIIMSQFSGQGMEVWLVAVSGHAEEVASACSRPATWWTGTQMCITWDVMWQWKLHDEMRVWWMILFYSHLESWVSLNWHVCISWLSPSRSTTEVRDVVSVCGRPGTLWKL